MIELKISVKTRIWDFFLEHAYKRVNKHGQGQRTI